MAAESSRSLSLEEEIEGDFQGSPDLVFCRIGNPVSLKPTGSAFDLSNPPSQPLAVSERHGLLFLAHSEGFFVANTKDVIGIAKESKDKGSGQCIQNSSIVDVQIGRVSILALSGDSSMLSATVGGEIHLFYVRSLLDKVQEPAISCPLNKSGIVKDLRWRKCSENFIVLSSHGSLFHGSSSLQLKDVMNNVDAVDWSLDGNYVAIARKDTVSILSSDFKEKLTMSLLFQSWPADPDSEIKVDSIKWVRHDSIIIGCMQLKEDGSEDGYLVQVITSGEHKFTEVSCKPVVFTFPDLFEGLSVDMFPSGVGPYLLSDYLDCWDVAVASNKKNIDQHISILRWLVEGNKYEVVSLELGSDRYIPRIDLQDDGDDNLILGLGLDKISLYEKINIQHGVEFRELSPRCILLFLTCDGKLTLYHAAWVSEPPDFPKMTSPYGDIVVTQELNTSSPTENVVGVTTSRLKDELDNAVSGKKEFSLSKPAIGTGGKMESHGKLNGMEPRSHPGSPLITSSDSRMPAIQELSMPSTAGYIGANSTIYEMPSDSSTIKGTGISKTLGSSITMGSLFGSHAVGKPSGVEGSNASASSNINGNGTSKSPGSTSTVGYPFQALNAKPIAMDASSAKHLSSSPGELASTRKGHKMLFSPTINSDLPTFSKSFSTLASSEKITQSGLNTTSVKLGHTGSASSLHSSQVPASSKLPFSRQQHLHANTTISKPRQILESEPEFSKQFYSVKDMAMELDSLLSSIECEDGFKDRCTIIQENSLLVLEAGLYNLSELARVYRNKVEDQLMEIQQFHIKMLQVSARQVYMEGIVKQASDSRYREIWNSQKLCPEFEAKRLRILNLKQDLSNQLIELERHFNSLEINIFVEYDSACPGRRAPHHSLAPSRQTQSLHNIYSTVNSQLATAEQLSECLSKQMELLNIRPPSLKKQNATKELFKSIGLDPESDSFMSPDLKGTKLMTYSSKRTSLSSSSTLKEQPWKSASNTVKDFGQEFIRRKRDSLDRSWGHFEPARTILKRTLKEERSRSNLDTPFKVAKEVFDCQLKAFDITQKIEMSNLHRASTKAFDSEARAFDITKQTSNGAASSISKMTFTNSHYLEHSTSKGIQENSSKETIEAQPKSMFKWANDHSDLPSGSNTTLSPHSSQVFHRATTQASSLAVPSLYTKSSSSNKNEKFGSPFISNMGSSFTLNHSSSAAIKTAQASKPASNVQFEASISTQMRLSSMVFPVKAASTAQTWSQLSQGASLKSVGSTENLAASSESLSASIAEAATSLSSSSSFPSFHFEKSFLPNTFLSPSTSHAPFLFSNEVNFNYEPSLAKVPATEGSLIVNKTSSELELATSMSTNNTVVDAPVKVLSSPTDQGSAELEADALPASVTVKCPPIKELGLHMSTSVSMGTIDTNDSKLQQITSPTPATTIAPSSKRDSSLPSISDESGLPAASGSQPEVKSVLASSSIMTTEKDESLDANLSQEDEMEEEALDTNSVLNLESLCGFAVGSTPSSSTPKPNPFGSSFAPAITGSASPQLSWGASPGQLFRPSSFNLPASQPSQLSGTNSLTGDLSGGFSRFGQPAQLGAGQQALGSVLGSFGQSRQLGAGMPGFGFATPGFSAAGSSGGFGNTGLFTGAATGGGFAGAVTGGGFAAAASGGGGGFSAAASAGGAFVGASSGGGFNAGGFGAFSSTKGGGFSAFSGDNSSAGRPPAELLMQMRK